MFEKKGKLMANKYGVSMGGRIINTNKVKSIKCNCEICGWAKMLHSGSIYCQYYKKNDPAMDKCKRYYEKEYTPTKGEFKQPKTR